MTNFLATLAITAYVATGHPAANGHAPRVGITVAGPRSLPFGTMIYIENIGWREITDRTARKYDGRIDIPVLSKKDALQFGKQYRRVWIKKKP